MGLPFTVLGTLALAFRRIGDLRAQLIRPLAIPLLISIAVSTTILLDIPDVLFVLGSIVGFVAQVVIAITVHRLVLLDETSVPRWGIRAWTLRETRFLGYSAIIWLLLETPYLLAATGAGTAVLVTLAFILAWITSRLSLVLPSTAIGAGLTLRDSWQATRPHQATMLMAVIVIPVVIYLVFGILGSLLAVSHLTLGILVSVLLLVLITVLVVVVLSLAYQSIVEGGAEGAD